MWSSGVRNSFAGWARSGEGNHKCNRGGNKDLLLCLNPDLLSDRSYMTFGDDGPVIASPLADVTQVARVRVATAPPPNVGPFSFSQAGYLAYYCGSVCLRGR